MEVSQIASHGRGGGIKERTEEDGVRGEEGFLIKGALIRNLQDADGQGIVSDGGKW